MPVDFGATAHLSTRLALYIPDKDCNGQPVENVERWIAEAQLMLTTLFGGCTTMTAFGMWHDRVQGIFIEETTAIVSAYVNQQDVARNVGIIRDFIDSYLNGANQEAVAVEYDGRMHFVSLANVIQHA